MHMIPRRDPVRNALDPAPDTAVAANNRAGERRGTTAPRPKNPPPNTSSSPQPPCESSSSSSSRTRTRNAGRDKEQTPSLADDLRAALPTTILPLLTAFTHRHRNQHRSSPWWSTFGVFRRALARLAALLDAPGRERRAADGVTARVAWLGRHVLPRAYVAFSQLTADNQHAPLGLLLLGLVAHVHAIAAKWLPQDELFAQEEHTARMSARGGKAGDLAAVAADTTDRGISVSRKTAALGVGHDAVTATLANREYKSSKPTTLPAAHVSRGKTKQRIKKKEKKADALSSLFGSLA